MSGRVPYLDDALPAAFLACSGEDLAHYLVACLATGRTTHALLSEVGFAELFRPQSPTAIAGASYALRWHVELSGGEQRIRHTGEVANFRSEGMMLPERKIGIVVLANCNNGLIADLGLDRIVPGIVSVLQGKQPATRKFTFKQLSVLLDIAVGLLSALGSGPDEKDGFSFSRQPMPFFSDRKSLPLFELSFSSEPLPFRFRSTVRQSVSLARQRDLFCERLNAFTTLILSAKYRDNLARMVEAHSD